MSNPYTGQVASALRKAQLLLQMTCETPLQRTALEEGVILQLWKAYKAFLAELSHQLQLDIEPESLQIIADSLEAQGRASNEVKELQQLGSESDTWLSQLLLIWSRLLSLSPSPEPIRKGANLIPLHNVASPVPLVVSAEVLQEWHAALSELVHRQRANLEEC
ncbi:DUF6586 family protein [Microbulbifer epialgicus]|uniref:DUF6586 family protein n=1 Tax=Microbulbifer epialgicus TaxID=393907 RepID=A0ABV4P1X2_9GAMM